MKSLKDVEFPGEGFSCHQAMEEYSQLLLGQALQATNGDREEAARMLGLKDVIPASDSYHDLMERYSRFLLVETLFNANGNLIEAAKRLHLAKPYLARLLKHKGIDLDEKSRDA